MTKKFVCPILMIAACLIAGSAFSESLPKSAKRLSASDAKALYAGKSANWKKSKAYFSPDGKLFMIGKDKSWYGEGKWSVSGNKVCGKLKWTSVKGGKTGSNKDCWTWYRDGKRYLTSWSSEKKQEKRVL